MSTPSPLQQHLSASLPFWDALTPDQRQRIEAGTRPMRAAAGTRIQGNGAGCAGVILCLEGNLRAYMLSEGGKEITLFRVEAGESCVLAASCILPMITFDIALDAASDSGILVIDPALFSRIASENPAVEAFLYKQTAYRFSDCMWVMQQVLFASFDARLATFLLDEASRNASPRIAMTHDQIARHLGSAREVVSRMLKYFEREGLVALGRGTIEIADRRSLLEIAASN